MFQQLLSDYRCPRRRFIALWIANNLVVILKVCDYYY